ncbi:MAG: DUF4340 domain-containing protein [Bacteroidetes bacterium]|nr:DUF4340 domain-containing protein [Bacteroidota bacterium]MBU1114514.1 DUF4340 domain-containing protein [Bacteroidota bacterium]MBU1799698.1 DUF4340 domain-containing protein [Bacteroidota bacterium]
MPNLKSNKTQFIILLILVLAVIYIYFGDGVRKESNLKADLISIDTSKVSEIILSPKSNGEKVKLHKENDGWKVELSDNKFASVPTEKVINMLSTLLKIKPNVLVSRKKENWDEYQVGENATKVEIYENGNKNLDLVVGKYSFQQPRQMNSYVRLASETEVYEVDGFLEMQFNQKKNSFRDNTIIKDNESNWVSLKFNYPDEKYSMIRDNGTWKIDGIEADSLETVNYLKSLARLSSTEYIDNFVEGKTTKTITIERDDSTNIVLNEMVSNSTVVVNSSVNKESFFDAAKNELGNKIFVNKNIFIK